MGNVKYNTTIQSWEFLNVTGVYQPIRVGHRYNVKVGAGTKVYVVEVDSNSVYYLHDPSTNVFGEPINTTMTFS